VVSRLGNAQWKQMVSTGTWRPECPVDRNDLRRVDLNHYTFSGDVRRGAVVVNRDVADSISRIFSKLYEEKFPIRKMHPVEAYQGDSHASLRADNTSAYNCRRPSQINAPVTESPHANGRAIDINPRENPWIDLRCRCWFPSRANREREPGPGKIFEGGLVWRTFRAEGWIWQNIDVPDYMHFDTGYPSGPYESPRG
jgi:D-alanyl-D-alanine carboxypeptidase-like protein